MTAEDKAGHTYPPLRIAFDAHVLDGRHQGSRTVIWQLARAMATAAPNTDVILYSAKPIDAADHPPNLRWRPARDGGSLQRLLFDLPRLARQDGVDTMIFQYVGSPRISGNCVIIHDILPYTHPEYFPLAFRIRCNITYYLSALGARTIFAVSEYTANALRAWAPWAARKIHVVRNGPSFDSEIYFSAPKQADLPREVSASTRYVFVVGRIEPRKNVHLLARAFRRAGLHDVHLVIAGKPDLGFSVNALPENTILIQDADDRALVALHQHASLFVYPSAAEGFGLPLLDAVLFGTPTIASDQTALPEVGGTLAEYFDPTAPSAEAELAERIRLHFTGERRLARPSDAARREHLERFSWRASGAAAAQALLLPTSIDDSLWAKAKQMLRG